MSQSSPLNSPSYLTPPVYTLVSSAQDSSPEVPAPRFAFPSPYILVPTRYPVSPISPGLFPLSNPPPPPFLSPSPYQTPVLFTPPSVSPIPPFAHQWAPNPGPDSPVSFGESAPSQFSSPPPFSSPQATYPDTPSSRPPFPSEFFDSYSQTQSSPSECVDCRLERDEEWAKNSAPLLLLKDQTKTSPISREEALAEVKRSGKLFVGGLTQTTTAEQLKDYFSQFGGIIECFVKMSREHLESRGFGFVTYAHPSKIEDVLSAGPLVLNGNTLDVRLAIPKHMADVVEITLGCRKIFVGGLSKKTNEAILQEYFSAFGSVQQVLALITHSSSVGR